MAIAPTVKYFGERPSAIVMQSSSQLDGITPQGSVPVITPAMYVFPAQAGGGLFNFHEEPITVERIDYSGGGTLTVKRVNSNAANVQFIVANLPTDGDAVTTPIDLVPGEYLMCVTSGASTPTIQFTSRIASAPGIGV